MDYPEPTKRGKSPRVKESAEATDRELLKVSQNLPKQPEPYVIHTKVRIIIKFLLLLKCIPNSLHKVRSSYLG